jgi:hypothetical protein
LDGAGDCGDGSDSGDGGGDVIVFIVIFFFCLLLFLIVFSLAVLKQEKTTSLIQDENQSRCTVRLRTAYVEDIPSIGIRRIFYEEKWETLCSHKK